MIELHTTGHNEICGGYSYSGYATFSGRTVKEVLEEIKEYAKESGGYLGEGFGNPKREFGAAWGIRINDKRYLGNWAGWKNEYNHEYDNWVVTKIRVNGGWYCFYDFDIECEKNSIYR